MLAAYDSHLLCYMQIFKGLIHKAEATTAALPGDLLYGSQALADEDDCCPKSPLFTVPPLPASQPLVPAGRAGPRGRGCTHRIGHPSTCGGDG